MSSTIKDVAKQAGVSIATVSYVLNNTRQVRPETRRRVEEVIAELHYAPNPAARHLRGGASQIIGFITPTCTTAFYTSVLSACEKELADKDYSILIGNSNRNLETERELIRTLGNGIVDGLIIFSLCQNVEELQAELPKNIPCVILDIHFPVAADCITHSFSDAFHEVVSYYKHRAHKQIAFFVGYPSYNSVQAQHSAYRRAMQSSGLPYDPELCVYFTNRSDSPKQVKRLLERGCTAMCFVDFNIMFNTFYNPDKQDFSIPPECDIVCGCESPIDYFLLKTIPRIVVPTEEIGQLAAKQILFRIQIAGQLSTYESLPQRILIPCTVQYPQPQVEEAKREDYIQKDDILEGHSPLSF